MLGVLAIHYVPPTGVNVKNLVDFATQNTYHNSDVCNNKLSKIMQSLRA
jgi:hypothetical protein